MRQLAVLAIHITYRSTSSTGRPAYILSSVECSTICTADTPKHRSTRGRADTHKDGWIDGQPGGRASERTDRQARGRTNRWEGDGQANRLADRRRCMFARTHTRTYTYTRTHVHTQGHIYDPVQPCPALPCLEWMHSCTNVGAHRNSTHRQCLPCANAVEARPTA